MQWIIKNKLLKQYFLIETFCFHNLFFQVISYDSSRGGVSVITEKGDVTTSFLLIQHADISDSGKYSCSPSNADVASVRVHVLNGKFFFYILFLDKTKNRGCNRNTLTR